MPTALIDLPKICIMRLKLTPWIVPPIRVAIKINVPGDESQLIESVLGFLPV